MASLTRIYSNDLEEIEEKAMEILSHSAWYGDISGIECEDILRGLKPGSYLLREGERKFQYYLSFVIGDSFTFKHQPFCIINDCSQIFWGYQNGVHRSASSLEDLISMVLHCPLAECYPVSKINHTK